MFEVVLIQKPLGNEVEIILKSCCKSFWNHSEIILKSFRNHLEVVISLWVSQKKQKPETRTQKPETRKQKQGTRNQKPIAWKPEAEIQKTGTRNQNRKPEARNQEQ